MSNKQVDNSKQIDKVKEGKKGLLVTEYSDLYYVRGLDIGASIDVIHIVKGIVDYVSNYTWSIGLVYVPVTKVRKLKESGWNIIRGLALWVKPLTYTVKDVPSDVKHIIENRALVDTSMFSEEFLERGDFGRVFLGEVLLHIEGTESISGKVEVLRGYVELFVHSNGVLVLTLSIPLYGYELSSRDIIKLRYALESEGVIVEIQRWIYMLWSKLRRGELGELIERREGIVRVKVKTFDILEAYSTAIKYLVNQLIGRRITSMVELTGVLRNPWDIDYAMVFTELLRGKSRTIDVLRRFSIQLYSILHGTRKITSREALEKVIRRAYHYVPISALGEAGFPSPLRLVIGRVVTFITSTDTHVVIITRKYLGPNEYGLSIRLKHLTIIELITHLKQSLRVFEYMFTHRKLKSIDELVVLREEFSKIIDYIENTYFVVDRDMRQLFQRTRKTLEIDRLNSSVERKLETLNYIIMTRYQDRLNKMQLVLSILFGIFGVPFFLFSYFQWYYDYVTLGKSPNFLPVTIATWTPTILILILTISLYQYWRRKIYE